MCENCSPEEHALEKVPTVVDHVRAHLIRYALGLPVFGAVLHAVYHALAMVFGFPCI